MFEGNNIGIAIYRLILEEKEETESMRETCINEHTFIDNCNSKPINRIRITLSSRSN